MSNPKHDNDSSAIQPLIQALQFLALIFTITTPCLLLAGYSYYLGYINTFGIDSSLLNRGISEAITESWIVGIKFLIYLFNKMHYLGAWGLIVIACTLYTIAIVTKRKKLGLSNIILDGTLSKENQGPEYLGQTLYRWSVIWGLVLEVLQLLLSLAIIVLLPLATCLFPYGDGSKKAKEIIEKYQRHDCDYSIKPSSPNCMTLIDLNGDKHTLINGIFITASKSHIAIYSNNQTEIWPIRDDYKLITNNHSKVTQETNE